MSPDRMNVSTNVQFHCIYYVIILFLRYIYNLINVLFYVYISAFCWRFIGKGKNSIEGVWKPTPIVQELSPTRVRMQEENLQYK